MYINNQFSGSISYLFLSNAHARGARLNSGHGVSDSVKVYLKRAPPPRGYDISIKKEFNN